MKIREKGILVEQDCTPAIVSQMEAVRKKVVLEVLDGFCKVMMCHFTAMCLSIAPHFPRRGPGFQLQTLSLVCSAERLGMFLSK